MRTPLTEMQQKVYHYLVDYIRKNRYPPTIREIMGYFGFLSSNSVVTHLNNLRKKGYITSGSNRHGM